MDLVSPTREFSLPLSALALLLQTYREEGDPDRLWQVTLTFLDQHLPYPLVWLAEYLPFSSSLWGKGGTLPQTQDHRQTLQRVLPLQDDDLFTQAIAQQRPIGIYNLMEEDRLGLWKTIAQQCGIRGGLILPIVCRDRCFGLLFLGQSDLQEIPSSNLKATLAMICGALGDSLERLERLGHQTLGDRAQRVLLELLQQTRHTPSLNGRLEQILTSIHQWILPDDDPDSLHTAIYWYSPENRYFWQRLSNLHLQPLDPEHPPANVSGFTVAELPEVYDQISQGQWVYLDAQGSNLSPDTVSHLQEKLQLTAFLAAPLIWQQRLLGLIALELKGDRLWQTQEKTILQGAADLLAFQMVQEQKEILTPGTDYTLPLALTHLLAEEEQIDHLFLRFGQLVCQHLMVDHFLILEAPQEASAEHYYVFLQTHGADRQHLRLKLPLRSMPQTIPPSLQTAEDVFLEEEWAPWREVLRSVMMASLCLCPCPTGDRERYILLLHSKTRTWQPEQQAMVQLVALTAASVYRFININERSRRITLEYQTLTKGMFDLRELVFLEQDQLMGSSVQYLADLLHLPMASLVYWDEFNGEQGEQEVTMISFHQGQQGPPERIFVDGQDSLIQAANMTSGFYRIAVEDLQSRTGRWLMPRLQPTPTPPIRQVWAIALTPSVLTSPVGLLVFGDEADQRPSEERVHLVQHLVAQLAWLLFYQRHTLVTQELPQDLQTYQLLNWYKHASLRILHQSLSSSVGLFLNDVPAVKGAKSRIKPVQNHQKTMLKRQLEDTLTLMIPVLSEEKSQWQIHMTSIPLLSVLHRVIHHSKTWCNYAQINVDLHAPEQMNVYGDPLKLECILFEILQTASHRLPAGSHITFYPRFLQEKKKDAHYLNTTGAIEILVLENYQLGDKFEQEFAQRLKASHMLMNPGSNLQLCQRLLRFLQGDLQFYCHRNGEYWSRLILPREAEFN